MLFGSEVIGIFGLFSFFFLRSSSGVRLFSGSGVLDPLREHPRHAGARPPHSVRRRHLREERFTEGKHLLSDEVLPEIR